MGRMPAGSLSGCDITNGSKCGINGNVTGGRDSSDEEFIIIGNTENGVLI